MDVIIRLLIFAPWVGVGVLLLLLYRIAHFYQVTSGQASHYRLFLIPLTLLLLGGLRYALAKGYGGDVLGDGLQFLGGVALIGLGLSLVRMMTGGRK
jgi:hypothetical protein